MRFKVLCDENISGGIYSSLVESGFDVTRVSQGMKDSEIAVLTKKEKRIILTFDSDFANILAYPPKDFYGIIRIKIDPPVNAVVVTALQKVFKALGSMEGFRGKLVVVEAWKFRVWQELSEAEDLAG